MTRKREVFPRLERMEYVFRVFPTGFPGGDTRLEDLVGWNTNYVAAYRGPYVIRINLRQQLLVSRGDEERWTRLLAREGRKKRKEGICEILEADTID